jgi:hypothetical protein
MQQVVPYQANKISEKEGLSLKEKLVYSTIGLVVVGGGIYFGRKFILNKVANKEENQSFDEGSSATTAKQIKMAFDNDGWWGTNTTALRTALQQVKTKDEFTKVQKSYQKLYNSNLIKDMSDELQSTEYNEMLQIIAGKPQKQGQATTINAYDAWAKRLKAAFDKSYSFLPGTDSEAIIAVFNEIPTQSAFIQTAVSYKKLYAKNLIDDLKSEAEFGQYAEWMKIITSKPKGSITATPPKKNTSTSSLTKKRK